MTLARMGLVMEILPAGNSGRGLRTSQVTAALERRGVHVHRDTLLRNLKDWSVMLGLISSMDEEGTLYWRRSSRRHGFAHLLDLDNLLDDSMGSHSEHDMEGGFDEHDVPDWSSQITFWGRGSA